MPQRGAGHLVPPRGSAGQGRGRGEEHRLAADLDAGVDTQGSVNSEAGGADVDVDAEVGAEADVTGEDERATESGYAIATDGMSETSAAITTEITGETLAGAEVYDAEGNNISTVQNLGVNAENEVTHILIDVGGFLGVGERTVAVAVSDLEIESSAEVELSLHLNMTRSQIEELPEFSS